jgi:hypothetical protein
MTKSNEGGEKFIRPPLKYTASKSNESQPVKKRFIKRLKDSGSKAFVKAKDFVLTTLTGRSSENNAPSNREEPMDITSGNPKPSNSNKVNRPKDFNGTLLAKDVIGNHPNIHVLSELLARLDADEVFYLKANEYNICPN